MNYFDFFELPERLRVDEDLLKKKFYQNSRKFHPDYYTLSDDSEQQEALRLSSINNEGYKVLLDFEKRVYHLLVINDQMQEEGSNEIPQDFLMEMMDVNEKLMELEFDFDPEQYDMLLKQCQSEEKKLRFEIEDLMEIEVTHYDEENWQNLKAFYFKNQYIKRLKANLDKVQKDADSF